MLQGILRSRRGEERPGPSRTILKVKMRRSPKQVRTANSEERDASASKENGSSSSLQVPVDKRLRRLSDSLDFEKQKIVPRTRRRSVSFDPFTVFKTAILDNDVDTTREVMVSGKVDANTSVDGVLPILLASKDGCAECLELLIEHGAQIDVNDKHGLSPLELAVREGHFDCAQVLISAGANAICIRDGYFDDTIEQGNQSTGRSRSRTF